MALLVVVVVGFLCVFVHNVEATCSTCPKCLDGQCGSTISISHGSQKTVTINQCINGIELINVQLNANCDSNLVLKACSDPTCIDSSFNIGGEIFASGFQTTCYSLGNPVNLSLPAVYFILSCNNELLACDDILFEVEYRCPRGFLPTTTTATSTMTTTTVKTTTTSSTIATTTTTTTTSSTIATTTTPTTTTPPPTPPPGSDCSAYGITNSQTCSQYCNGNSRFNSGTSQAVQCSCIDTDSSPYFTCGGSSLSPSTPPSQRGRASATRISVSPSACNAPRECSYICSASYSLNQRNATTLFATSTSSTSSCPCDTLVFLQSADGTTFCAVGQDITFACIGSIQGKFDVLIGVQIDDVRCEGVYQISVSQGTVLGLTPQTSAPASSGGGGGSNSLPIIAGAVAGGVILIIIVAVLLIRYRKKRLGKTAFDMKPLENDFHAPEPQSRSESNA